MAEGGGRDPDLAEAARPGHQRRTAPGRHLPHGRRPKTSVVDRNCRVHDLDNVYVIDGSVHVTNGGFNPVLTIMAIAYYASERIAKSQKGRGV